MIKLIATDMDGTFLNSDHIISKENIKAVNFARKNNVEFLIATGRAYYEALEVVEASKLKTELLTLNGAISYDLEGNITNMFTLKTEDSLFIINKLKDLNLTCDIYAKNCLYTNSIEEYVQSFVNLIEGQGHKADIKQLIAEARQREEKGHIVEVDKIEDYVNIKDNPAIKIIIFNNDEKKLTQIKNILEENKNICVTSSGVNNLEIMSREVSKGNAIKEICKKRGISMDNVMTLGDNLNDLSMIALAKYSVAMKNANSKLKEKASYISDFDNNNSGVGKMIEKLLKEVNGIQNGYK